MNRLRIFSVSALLLILFSSTLPAQTNSTKTDYIDKFRKSAIGFMSLGFKNTYGACGAFYLHRIPLGKIVSRFRIGCGIKESFVVGGGLDLRLYTNHKRLEFFCSADYSYNFPGTIQYDNDRVVNYPTDRYNFSACNYLHTYLSSHYLFKNANASLQLKTGYTFLLNTVTINHTFGPNNELKRATQMINGGPMIGLDLIIFFTRKGAQ